MVVVWHIRSWSLQNLSEQLTIFVLGAIAITAMVILGVEAKEVISAIGGGLTGYLARGKD